MTFPLPLDLFALILFASVLSLIGGVVFLYTKHLYILLEKYGVPFAAGTMIVTALIGLLPEALHAIGPTSFVVFTFSFFLFYVLEKLLVQFHHHVHADEDGTQKPIKNAVPIVLIGDTIHNFIDGVAIAVAYAIHPGLAVITAISTFLHEVPHEIGDFSILLKAGYSKRNVIGMNVLSALVSILGAVLVSYISPSEVVIGYLLAFTAGIFFYLGVVDFLPHAFDATHNASYLSKLSVVAAVLAGAMIMTLSLLAVPHSHEDEHGHEQESIHAGSESDTHDDEGDEHDEDESEHAETTT